MSGTILSKTSFILFILMVNLISGCSYYRVKPVEGTGQKLSQFNQKDKYFIIHYHDTVFHLDSIDINGEQQFLTGSKKELPEWHLSYRTTKEQGKNRYKRKNTIPNSEIHLYVNNIEETNGKIFIPFRGIERTVKYYPAPGATVLNIIGVTALIGVLPLIYMIATYDVGLGRL